MRKAIIAGNWKMHYTPEEAVKLVNELKPLVKDATCDVVVCPTFVCLDAVLNAIAAPRQTPENSAAINGSPV